MTNQFQPDNTLTGNILVKTIRTDDRSSGLLSAFQGNGGDIFLDSRNSIQLNGGCFLIQCVVQTSSATGDSGDISFLATGDILVAGGTIVNTETTRGNGQAGTIEIQGNSIILSERSQLIADTGGQGNAGDINLFGRGNIDVLIDQNSSNLTNTAIGSRVRAGAVGNAGTVTVRANNFNLEGQIQTIVQGSSLFSPGGNGNGGNVVLDISGESTISGQSQNLTTGIFTRVQPGATGNAGNIIINAGSLTIENTNFGGLDASLRGEGNAGNIDIRLSNDLNLSDGSFIATPVFPNSIGAGGDISLSALNINLSNFSQILTTSFGNGSSGSLSILAREAINIDNQSAVSTGVISSEGSAGSLSIKADTLSLQNGSLITSSTAGAGNAGQLDIQINRLNTNRGSITASSEGTGNAGAVSIVNAEEIILTNGSEISTGSLNAGNAGKIFIDSATLSLRNNSVLVTATVGAGNAGELNIQADLVELLNSSRISTETGASNVFALDSLPVSTGNAGPITINTSRLILQDGEIATSANLRSLGRAGTLTINASESIDIGGISETTLGGLRAFAFGTEQGGDIFVDTGRLTLRDGGRIDAGTAGLGNGGNVIVNAREFIDIAGTSAPLTSEQIEALVSAGLVTVIDDSSNSAPLPSGISSFNIDGFVRNEFNIALGNAKSGNVELLTPSLTIRDGAEISTAVLGNGDGGFIQIDAESMNLRNTARIVSRSEGRGQAGNIIIDLDKQLQTSGGEISASSDLAGGGDLNITTDNLLLSNGSLLSTSVFDSTGGGGNITIDANAFAAIEDSDILANAEFGPGGSISINSPAFLATLFESGTAIPVGRNPGSFAQFRGNGRVDISADSAGGQTGTVSLPNLVTDEGLNELPTDLIDPTSLIDQRCDLLASQQSQDGQTGQFTVVGRGGLPLTPEQQLEATQLLDDLGPEEIQPTTENVNAETVTPAPVEIASERIVEPLGWRRSDNGRLYLYASASASETAESHLAQRCGELSSTN